jgi:hypothetical protein
MWHSCSNYALEHHFQSTLDAFLDVTAFPDGVEVIPQKTLIAIQAEVRFAGCIVRKRWLLASLWLTRVVEHPRLRRTETFGPNSYGHQFQLNVPEDVDAGLRELIAEAYQAHHFDRSAETRVASSKKAAAASPRYKRGERPDLNR